MAYAFTFPLQTVQYVMYSKHVGVSGQREIFLSEGKKNLSKKR